ncbi:hypothetical protein SAMN05428988_6297 [Chitinophaga sp. YR573]|nr:hypothetical protein SAMN05428988_6297 [Chitinophaga sp. YR573]
MTLFGILIRQKVIIFFRLASENKKMSIITHVTATHTYDRLFISTSHFMKTTY